MEDFIFVKMLEGIYTLAKDLDRLLFGKESSFFDIGIKITFIAILKDQVVVVGSLLHIVQFDDVAALT